MSAPDTHLEVQAKRHKPSLLGIGFAGGAVAVVIAVLALWPSPIVEDANQPAAAATSAQ